MKQFKIHVTAFMIIALTFGLGGLSFLAFFQTRAVVKNNLEAHITSLTLSSSSEVGLWLNAHKTELEIMANTPLMESGDKDMILLYMNKEIQHNKVYEEFFYADLEGNFLLNSGQEGSILDRNYFNKVIATGKSTISDPIFSKGSGNHIIAVAAPIKKGDKVIGLFGGSISLSKLIELVSSKKVGELGNAFIVQKDGLMIIHPKEDFIMSYNGFMYNRTSLDYQDTINKMIRGETGVARNTFQDGDKYIAYAPVPGIDWSLGVTVPVSYVLNQLIYLPIYFFVITGCLGSVLVVLMRLWLVYPLTQLEKFTAELNDNIYGQESNYQVRSPVIEVESLGINFRRMALTLQENFRKLESSKVSLKEEIIKKMMVQKDLESSYEELEAVEEELRFNYEKLQAKEKLLRESERRLRSILENVKLITGIMDKDGRIIFCNEFILGLTGFQRDEVVGHNFFDVLVPLEFREEANIWLNEVLNSKEIVMHNTYPIQTKNGNKRYVHWNHTLLFDAEGNVSGVATIGEDITDRKQIQDKLEHMSFHDSLTELYNRTYFEEKMRLLQGDDYAPVGIIVCDVDGLKLVNDTLGHSTGDKLLWLTAGIIKKCFREEDLIFRIGGDEFAIILPKSELSIVEQAYYRIRKAVDRYNVENEEFPLSLSIGFAVSGNQNINTDEVFKEADDGMYREKLHRSKSTRSAIVQAMMKALEARDFITEGHADRLQELVILLGQALAISERTLADLRLLAQFHDIGKVGIPDSILFKSGRLTGEEFKEMQRHSEIGHRIAQSAPDLQPIADCILRHHEWWNGQGYPLGLKEDEIPLECRILAIADAYDAMTSNRPYRKAMSQKQAFQELNNNMGIQFDPQLVPIFIKIISSEQFHPLKC